MERSQTSYLLDDLKKKVVFLTGPRQVGKTWLAKHIATHYSKPYYLNYDNFDHRQLIHNQAWPDATDLLIFDEIHKKSDWKNFIKGLFDTKPESLHLLVTGSARLETLRQSGDAMTGRFFRHRLLPFSYKEIGEKEPKRIEWLLQRGGFPEPFLAENPIDSDRWRLHYIDGLIRTDILDFERIHDLKTVQLILELLRRKVGSPISFLSIAQDVAVSPTTVKKYIEIMESLYILFRVTPYSHNIARSLLKEPKIYFYDTGLVVGDEGARFENLIAVSLLKHVWGKTDYLGKQTDLYYLRTKDGEEVDFCIVEEGRPIQIVEVKMSARDNWPALRKMHEKYSIPAVVVIKNLKREYKDKNIPVVSAEEYLQGLFL
jgi:predicted AAA+ superfamily ATPase